MDRFRGIAAAVEAGALRRQGESGGAPPRPFITISRQAGIDVTPLLEKLIARLRELDAGDPAWASFDRELVEKVVSEHGLHKTLVESLGDSEYTWLDDLFAGLSFGPGPEPAEFVVYRRVAQTIRVLAQVGRTVIVGRGGVFITRDLPAGLHVYLVAPFAERVERFSRSHGIDMDEAVREVRRIDYNREAFYGRYWPEQSLKFETFTATFNVAAASESAVVEAIAALTPRLEARLQ